MVTRLAFLRTAVLAPLVALIPVPDPPPRSKLYLDNGHAIEWYIGSPTGDHLHWNGSTLRVQS